jgi:two-component system, chemotaxis family, chemotaxis protein CheY
MNVLIADDDRTMRFIMRQILWRDFGATVVEAADGLEALKAMTSAEFDLVVLDLHMPGLDGIGVLTALRGVERLRSVPVLILSADRDEALVRQTLQLGVVGYLTKPFNAEQMSKRLQQVFATSGTDAAPAATGT